MDDQQRPAFDLQMTEGAERQNVKGVKLAPAVDDHERDRDYLTDSEMKALLAAARKGRFGVRDHALLLVMYRHGLRVSELVSLKWKHIDLDAGRIWINRKKAGLSTTQPLQGDEVRALRAVRRNRKDGLEWVFLSSQCGQMVRQAVNYLVKEAAKRAGLDHVHPHMMRHSCGHALAEKGTDTRLMQDWLGHRDIRHTAWYSRTSAKRFDGVWE
jgi:type 1 fimbriae regulatory protein FimB